MMALLQRDLILAIRAGGGFGLGMAFFLIVVVLVPLGIGPDMVILAKVSVCLLYTSPSPRDGLLSRMPSSA